jgi:hypothetical protein
MPYKSEAQRSWMHINKPELAKEWDKKYDTPKKLPYKKDSLLDKLKIKK